VLGSKVPLSLNVDSFRVINRYNGRKTKFDVYLDKVDPITPKFTGTKENQSFSLSENCETFYEETTEFNGVEIQVDVKKHNMRLLFEAMESQLMYMPNIKIYHRPLGAMTYTMKEIRAKELYRDQDIIISETSVYDKPHILIGAGDALINYGLIAFNELEIEPKRGSVGLIMDISDIEVTPSREAPVWSTKTRKAVLDKYTKVTQTAALFVNQSLSAEKDYIEWMVKADQTMAALKHGNNSSVIGKLASIIDSSMIKNVRYPMNTQVEFSSKVSEMLGPDLSARNITYDRNTRKVERKAIESPGAMAVPVYFTEGVADPFKDRYIFDTQGPFVLIQTKENYERNFFAKLVLSSSRLLQYDDVDIPLDILDVYKTADIIEDTNDTGTYEFIDRSALRKENAQIPVHFISKSYSSYVFSSVDTYISDIPSLFDVNKVAIYGTSADRQEMKDIAGCFPHRYLKCYDGYRNTDSTNCADGLPVYTSLNKDAKPINMIIIARENIKYLGKSNKYKTISEFVVESYNKNSNKLVFSKDIRTVATAAVIESIARETGLISILKDNKLDFIFPTEYSEYKEIFNGWFDYSFAAGVKISKLDFYKEAIQLHLCAAGILSDDPDTLITRLNATVPDSLCDSIDQIDEVEILDIPTIVKWKTIFEAIAPYREILSMFIEKYYSNDATRVIIGNQIKEYISLKNDEILQ